MINNNLSIDIALTSHQTVGTTGVAVGAAIGGGDTLKSLVTLTPQIPSVDTAVDHGPRHHLAAFTLTIGIESGINAALFKCLLPTGKREIIVPSIEMCALTPSSFLHLAKATVATGEDGLQEGGLAIVPVIGDSLGGDGFTEQLHAALVLLAGDLRLPLEGGVGLGDPYREPFLCDI